MQHRAGRVSLMTSRRMQLSNIAADRYSRPRMNRYPPSLLSRLRSRLGVTAWLFALLVLAKATLAAACINDGVAVEPTTKSGAIASLMISTGSTQADTVMSATLESGSGDSCWHDAAGGCHCACAHAAPMAGSSDRLAPRSLMRADFAAVPAFPILARREPALRPPIA